MEQEDGDVAAGCETGAVGPALRDTPWRKPRMTTRRDLLTSIPAIGTAFAVGGAMLAEGAARAQEAPPPLAGHFHPKGKAPSLHTARVLTQARASLPFSD